MLVKPGRGCNKPGCAGVVRSGVCDKCGPVGQGKDRAYDQGRGSANERGYGHRWRRLRLMFLRAHPLCVECQRVGRVVPATDVDHIVTKRDGGTDAWDNLQALCHACHSRKTMTELSHG